MDIRIDTFVIGNHYYINVYNEDERVGKLGIELISDCKVQIVYVVTNIRYVNNGIATMMLNHAIEKFGNCEISLLVKPMPRKDENDKYKKQAGLIKFYEKFGFLKDNDPCLNRMIRKPSLPTSGEK